MESKIGEILKKITNKEAIKKNSAIIGELLDEYNMWNKSINFDIPNEIKNSIAHLISNIDFFSGVTEEHVEQSLNKNQLVKSLKQMEGSNCSVLMELIATPANFCSQELLVKIKKMIDNLSIYINSYDLGSNVFEELNNQSRKQVIILSKKKKEIQKQYSSLNIPQQEIKSSIQSNSSYLVSKLKYDLQKFQTQTLQMLLKQYPILELSSSLFDDISILQVELIKSKSQSSEKQLISRQQKGCLVSENNDGGYMICYCDFILNKQKKYIIRVAISQLANNDNNLLCFGLCPDSCKDSGDIYRQYMIYRENWENGISQIVRGKQLYSGDGNQVNREFEMRIHLETKFLRVSDFPNYENVCELNDQNVIESNLDYRFAMESCKKSAKMIITQILEVVNFDDKM